MEITDRVALVTGAGSGIGRASAVALAHAGAGAVVVVDIDEAGAAETAALVKDSGSESVAVSADVSDLRQLRDAFGEAEKRFGALGIVHNNAGLVSGGGSFPATTPERMQRVIDVNVRGTLVGTRLAIDALGRSGGGVVVNTASVMGMMPMPDDPTYAATKAAIILFTQSCAGLRASDGIRVNAVVPGLVDTPIVAKTGDGEQPAAWIGPFLDAIVMLRPDQIAAAVIDLVLDDTKAGETVIVGNDLRGGTNP